jgi:hypothetical protein
VKSNETERVDLLGPEPGVSLGVAEEHMVDGGASHAERRPREEHGEGEALVPTLRFVYEVVNGEAHHAHATCAKNNSVKRRYYHGLQGALIPDNNTINIVQH